MINCRDISLSSVLHDSTTDRYFQKDDDQSLTSHASAWNTDMMMAPVLIIQQANTACTLNNVHKMEYVREKERRREY